MHDATALLIDRWKTDPHGTYQTWFLWEDRLKNFRSIRRGIGQVVRDIEAGTLVCCALPALLVSIGAGAALAGLVSTVPSLVLLSEYKGWVFGFCALMLAISGHMQWRNRYAPCPIDPKLAAACARTRRISVWVYGVSMIIFTTGVFFAFILPELT